MDPILDTLVIGAGQAGLASSYHLQRAGLRFRVLEAGAEPGGSWPQHYDGLRLFSPARFSSLPGLAFPGDPEHYPSRDAVSLYLRAYAAHFAFPITTNARVAAVRRTEHGFLVETATGASYAARTLIAATGSFHRPHLPTLPGQVLFGGRLLHSSAYRNTAPFQGQRVVVVGAGNSAVQIAAELAAIAHVTLATREPVRFVPQRPLGRDLHWWWGLTGFDRLPLDSWLGSQLAHQTERGGTPVLDVGRYQAAIAAGAPERRPMFTGFTEQGVIWSDGQAEALDAVIFATGYRPNLGYLAELGALDSDGAARHRQGMSTSVPGLAYVGLSNQRTYASATLRGVGADAAWVITRLQHFLRTEAAGSHTRREQPARCCAGLFGGAR